MLVSLAQMRRELDRLEASLNPDHSAYEITPAQRLKVCDMIIRKYTTDRPGFDQMAEKFPKVKNVIANLLRAARRAQRTPPPGEG